VSDENNDYPPLGEEQPRRNLTAAHSMATFVAMLRFGMGRADTPETALSDGIRFVRAAEAKWPGISKRGGPF